MRDRAERRYLQPTPIACEFAEQPIGRITVGRDIGRGFDALADEATVDQRLPVADGVRPSIGGGIEGGDGKRMWHRYRPRNCLKDEGVIPKRGL